MRNLIISAIVATGVLANGCSADPKEKKTAEEPKEEAVVKEEAVAKEIEKKITVKNELTLTVPEKNQKLMGLKTEKLSKDAKGSIIVPNISIQEINGKSSILLSLGDNKFALRYIEVSEKKEKSSLVKKNVLEDELVVTEGAAKLKAGVVRMMSGSHKGHSHGAGGHAH